MLKSAILKRVPATWKNRFRLAKLKQQYGDFAARMDTYHTSDADVFIVSFPKSGRTWLRFILSKYLEAIFQKPFHTGRIYHDTKAAGNLPVLAFTHDGSSFEPLNINPGNFCSDKSFYIKNERKTILLVRDPRDVVVSYFHHAHARKSVYTGTISEFIRDENWGIAKSIRFLNDWAEYTRSENVLLVRYEDLKSDDITVAAKVIEFARLPVQNKKIEKIVVDSRFDKMKNLINSGKEEASILKQTTLDPNSAKIRKGKVGGYREELSAADIRFVDASLLTLNPIFNYK